MRSLEEIKKGYLDWPEMYGPSEEEKKYYGLNNNIYKEWFTEKLIEEKEQLLFDINRFDSYYKLNIGQKKKNEKMHDIIYELSSCFDNYPATYSYYFCLPEIFKKMYENNLFDYLSYDDKSGRDYFANLVYYVRPKDMGMTIGEHNGNKYCGMLIQVYYNNKEIFEELLIYFKDVIYQKYGLYLQYDMSILIQFCYEYNLPYVDLLYEAHKKAMELDYPSHNEYKYQNIKRKEVKWEENVLKLRNLEELKDNYINNQYSKPTRHEMDYYKITEDVLEHWLKEKE